MWVELARAIRTAKALCMKTTIQDFGRVWNIMNRCPFDYGSAVVLSNAIGDWHLLYPGLN